MRRILNKEKLTAVSLLLFILSGDIFSQYLNKNKNSYQKDNKSIPLTSFFHRLDDHLVGSFTRDYGIPHLAAILGSYGMVESGLDWEWYNFSYENKEVYDAGFVSVEAGAIIPFAVPAGMYIFGRFAKDSKLQVAGLAVAQSALISLGITSAYKAITARRPPEEEDFGQPDYSRDFKFGLFNRGVFEGWPSGHTTTAFAMSFTLMELYPENIWVQIGAITYASAIGLGVSTNIHWFSDAFAGALIGYSIGKTVGSGFHSLLTGEEDYEPPLSFYASPGGVGLTYRF